MSCLQLVNYGQEFGKVWAVGGIRRPAVLHYSCIFCRHVSGDWRSFVGYSHPPRHLLEVAVAPGKRAREHLPNHNPKAVQIDTETYGVPFQHLWALICGRAACAQVLGIEFADAGGHQTRETKIA